MKIITTANWILVSLYGMLLMYTLINLNRSGNDAAGRGMELGFMVIGALLLAGLVWLNLRPWPTPKIIALLLAGLPLLLILYNLGSNYWVSVQQQKRDQAQGLNSRRVGDSDQ